MGQIYYDMGLMVSPDVVESSTSDLVGEYVEQTGPKTESLFNKALGKVLFIDDAYRLGDGLFGREALAQLVNSMTKPKYYQKLVIILAGYDDGINRLMSQNPGLNSRFSEAISFKPLGKDLCWELFQKRLAENEDITSDAVQKPSPLFRDVVLGFFDCLCILRGWGNARDVETIVNNIIGKVLAGDNDTVFEVTEQIVLSEMETMLLERRTRVLHSSSSAVMYSNFPMAASEEMLSPIRPTTVETSIVKIEDTEEEECKPVSPILATPASSDIEQVESRDDGVSDEVWAQLQRDKAAALEVKQMLDNINQQIATTKSKLARIESPSNWDYVGTLQEGKKYDMMLQELGRHKLELEEEAKRDEGMQQKLREKGTCGRYYWVKQENGYRCSGGRHFVSNEEL
jgi:ATPase family associated with various cellular activities (AAA)